MQKSVGISTSSLDNPSFTYRTQQSSSTCGTSTVQKTRLLRTPTKKRRPCPLEDSYSTPDRYSTPVKTRASAYTWNDSPGYYDYGLNDPKKAMRSSSALATSFFQLEYGGSGNNGGWGSPPRRRVAFWDDEENNNDFRSERSGVEDVAVDTSLKNFYNVFCSLLQTGLISGISLVLGDIISCLLRHISIDYKRCMCLLAFGIFAAGPLQYLFYSGVEVLIPGKGALDIVKKMMCDQGLHSPVYNFNFLTLGALLDGHSLDSALFLASNGVLGLWVASVKIWPMLHMINFKFVPAQMRIVFINGMNVLWLTAATMMSRV